MTHPDDPGAPHRNWWTTLPGVLTAVAALITAIAGLIAVMPKAEPGATPAATATVVSPAVTAPQGQPAVRATPASPAQARPAATDGTVHRGATALVDSIASLRARGFKGAVLTLEDGTVVPLSDRVREDGLGGPALRLRNGQQVAFDRMEQFEVVTFDENARRGEVVIHLLNGSRLQADVDAFGMAGSNELGPFRASFDKVRRVQFLR